RTSEQGGAQLGWCEARERPKISRRAHGSDAVRPSDIISSAAEINRDRALGPHRRGGRLPCDSKDPYLEFPHASCKRNARSYPCCGVVGSICPRLRAAAPLDRGAAIPQHE